jgi:hypothetical protein
MSQLARDRAVQANQAANEDWSEQRFPGPASIGEADTHLLRLRGIGPEMASVLTLEALYRNFADSMRSGPLHHRNPGERTTRRC